MSQAQEQIYEQARQAYLASVQQVKVIGTTLQKFYESKGQKFSADILLRQYDCILQYALVEYSIQDGNATADEIAFIMGMTENADLVEYINSKYKEKVSWKSVANADYDSIRSWLDRNKQFIDPLAAEFVDAFALVDRAVESEDMLDELVNMIVVIVGSLFAIDGDSSESAREPNYIKQVIGAIQNKIENM